MPPLPLMNAAAVDPDHHGPLLDSTAAGSRRSASGSPRECACRARGRSCPGCIADRAWWRRAPPATTPRASAAASAADRRAARRTEFPRTVDDRRRRGRVPRPSPCAPRPGRVVARRRTERCSIAAPAAQRQQRDDDHRGRTPDDSAGPMGVARVPSLLMTDEGNRVCEPDHAHLDCDLTPVKSQPASEEFE